MQIAASPAVSLPSRAASVPPLVISLADMSRVLGTSTRTITQHLARDPDFPRLFLIGKRKHAMFADLQRWVAKKAAAA